MIKTYGLSIFILFISLYTHKCIAQSNKINDTLQINKSGFAWGATPILAFDTDLGIRYGATINLFDYGNGNNYPKYLQYVRIKLSNSTKKTSNFSVLYDSEKFFTNTRILSEASYIRDVALNYLGYNGKNTNFVSEFVDPENELYHNKYYYNHQRKWFRAKIDVHRKITPSGLSIYAGIAYNKILTESVNEQALDIPTGSDDYQPNTESLHQSYKDWGVISADEAEGGLSSHFSLGVSFDTRNNPINCNKGIFLETYMLVAPKIGSNANFGKHIFTFRQYVTLPKAKMVFFYRFSSQQKLWGTIPFYFLPIYFDSQQNQDGMGGAFNLRGITRNRIVSNGFLLGNIELRKRVLKFPLFKLNFDIDLSLFSDATAITQSYQADYNKIPDEYRNILINDDYQKVYATYGVGLYIIYNVNNVISVNYGFSNDDQLGSRGLYVGSAFLF